MRIDGRTLASGTTLRAEIGVVGAGPVGLALAHFLSGTGQRVMLLEAGGSDEIDSVDALELEPSGTALEPLRDSRWRRVGGTAPVWNARLQNRPAARYLRLTPSDLEPRSWLPHSGWPFGYDELVPYYERAEHVVAQRPGRAGVRGAAPACWPLDPDVLVTTREPFGFARTFTDDLPAALSAKPDIEVVTNAMVTSIGTNESGRIVDRLTARAGGSDVTVEARRVVLAAGGIENARLLLLSGERGKVIGNEHDLVGRFFMDHPRVQLGHLVPFDRTVFDRSSAYDIREWDGRFLGGKLAFTEQFRGRHAMLNGAAHVIPHPSERDAAALESLKRLLADVRGRRLSKEAAANISGVLRGLRYVVGTGGQLAVRQRTPVPVTADGGWSQLRRNARRFELFEVVYQCEQAPNPDNRVVLGDRRDEFGMRRASVRSGWSDIDLTTIERVTHLLQESLASAGLGRLERSVEPGEMPALYQIGGAHHHLGTTRMHADPRHGVVDADTRVHGMDNLYVTGGSVFPTGGYANPTLTMIALAARLADHLATLPR